MNLRQGLAYLNLALFGAALAAEVLLPAYATIIFYAVLAWLLVSLVLFYGPGARGGLARPRPTAAGAPPPPPLASGPPTRIGFCVYCGTEMAPDAAVCPNCGRAPRLV